MKNKKMTDAYKNAVGTMFLLAGAFFICSTLLSMRTVLADPIAPMPNAASGRANPARSAAVTRASGSRSTASRTTTARTAATRTTTLNAAATSGDRGTNSRAIKTRSISVRSSDGSVKNVRGTTTRNVASRTISGNTTMRGTAARNASRVVARTGVAPARVSLVGNGLRASSGTGVSVSYLTNKLYTGNYSNIIDSTTGLISADAYSTCLESYYTCMDEICTARSDTKGRCSCAGRATNFLAAEEALDRANEELIQLSGQLALLVSTKGKDVSEAFKLTDAEKVMNCVSWKDALEVAGTTKDSKGVTISKEAYMKNWCRSHMMYDDSKCSATAQPDYCSSSGNSFGFDISDINGSSSDILASLKAWADAKDLAKQFTDTDTDTLLTNYTTIAGIVNSQINISDTVDTSKAKLDTLANKWGYELFEYAHNNVCGRVLDSCFNGIYEACGTPPQDTDSSGNKIGKCANGASSSCPYNYNSAISVKTSGNKQGEVKLYERGSDNSTTSTTATCFGYTSANGDPYSSLRGPVADARRSIMQKYLLDANAACDTYGTALKNTAQNINYQKIAAEQALRQKRMEFYTESEQATEKDALVAITNFNNCVDEIWDCYNTNVEEATWSTARIKTYCAQVSNVPHCYEPMICNPTIVQFNKIIDEPDTTGNCKLSANIEENNCRNVVTLQEILNGTGVSGVGAVGTNNMEQILTGLLKAESAIVREACLLKALGCDGQDTDDQSCLRNFDKAKYKNANN